jgi:hypothetical protein
VTPKSKVERGVRPNADGLQRGQFVAPGFRGLHTAAWNAAREQRGNGGVGDLTAENNFLCETMLGFAKALSWHEFDCKYLVATPDLSRT